MGKVESGPEKFWPSFGICDKLLSQIWTIAGSFGVKLFIKFGETFWLFYDNDN